MLQQVSDLLLVPHSCWRAGKVSAGNVAYGVKGLVGRMKSLRRKSTLTRIAARDLVNGEQHPRRGAEIKV